MVESIKELRTICQKNESQHWYVILNRKLSIYITKLLLYTPLSANQVTLLQLLIIVLGCVFFISGQYLYSVLGALLLFLSNLLDYVDGEVARYKGTSGVAGEYLDELVHSIEYAVIFPSISFGVYNNLQDIRIFAFGFSASLFLLIYYYQDIFKTRILYDKLNQKPNKQVHKSPTETFQIATRTPTSLLLFIATSRYLRHYLILIGAILNQLYAVLFIYGITLPLASIVLISQTTKSLKKE